MLSIIKPPFSVRFILYFNFHSYPLPHQPNPPPCIHPDTATVATTNPAPTRGRGAASSPPRTTALRSMHTTCRKDGPCSSPTKTTRQTRASSMTQSRFSPCSFTRSTWGDHATWNSCLMCSLIQWRIWRRGRKIREYLINVYSSARIQFYHMIAVICCNLHSKLNATDCENNVK